MLGLDLAWGTRATTGACALNIASRDAAECELISVREDLFDDEDIMAWIAAMCEGWGSRGVMLAVDAPLSVPNATGDRPCDNLTRRRFAKYHAGPHPANRTLLGEDPRGERLVHLLANLGFRLDASLPGSDIVDSRTVFEVFPHPAHIVLFGRSRIIPYKAKPKRTLEARAAGMLEYGTLLRRLCDGQKTWLAGDGSQYTSGLDLPKIDLPDRWPLLDAKSFIDDSGRSDSPFPYYTALPRGGRLKKYEDGLDALTCAIVAYWYWWYGPGGAEILGDPKGGHIVVPRISEVLVPRGH